MSKAIRFKTPNNEPVYTCPYFPVGYIYMSTSSTNPSTYFGGTWERIKDRFILCAGDSYSAGSTGGSASHYHSTGNCTLSINQIPAHSHNVNYNSASGIATGSVIGTDRTSSYTETSSAGGHWHVWTTDTGGSQAHNHGNTGSKSNMPPYLAVYVWKRVS